MRLFIVDDETIIRKGIISILRQNCAFVEVAGEAANGKAALEAIGAACPDVVVTDIKMPVMDGVELTKRLHTLYPNIRVIVLSGYDDYCFVRLSMKYGAFDYLLKPIDKHEFLSVVRLLQQSELIEQGKIEPNANSLINSAKNYIRKHYANKLHHGAGGGLRPSESFVFQQAFPQQDRRDVYRLSDECAHHAGKAAAAEYGRPHLRYLPERRVFRQRHVQPRVPPRRRRLADRLSQSIQLRRA